MALLSSYPRPLPVFAIPPKAVLTVLSLSLTLSMLTIGCFSEMYIGNDRWFSCFVGTLRSSIRSFWPEYSEGYDFGRNSGKEPACQCRRCRRGRFNPWVGKIPWRRVGQPTLAFLPGKPHGQRSLAGYSPRGCKALDMTEATPAHMAQGIVVTPRKRGSDSVAFTRVPASAHGGPPHP